MFLHAERTGRPVSVQISWQIFCPRIKCHQLWILLIWRGVGRSDVRSATAKQWKEGDVFLCGTLQNI